MDIPSADKFLYKNFRKKEKELAQSDYSKPGDFHFKMTLQNILYKRAHMIYQSAWAGKIPLFQKDLILKFPKSTKTGPNMFKGALKLSDYKKEFSINLDQPQLQTHLTLKLNQHKFEPERIGIESGFTIPGHKIKIASHQENSKQGAAWDFNLTHFFQKKFDGEKNEQYKLLTENHLNGKKNLNSTVLALLSNDKTSVAYGWLLAMHFGTNPSTYKLNQTAAFVKNNKITSSLIYNDKGSGDKAKRSIIWANNLAVKKEQFALKLKSATTPKSSYKFGWRIAWERKIRENLLLKAKVSSKNVMSCVFKYDFSKNFKIAVSGQTNLTSIGSIFGIKNVQPEDKIKDKTKEQAYPKHYQFPLTFSIRVNL